MAFMAPVHLLREGSPVPLLALSSTSSSLGLLRFRGFLEPRYREPPEFPRDPLQSAAVSQRLAELSKSLATRLTLFSFGLRCA